MPVVVIDHKSAAWVTLGCLRNRWVFVMLLGPRLCFLAPEAKSPIGEIEGAEEDEGCKELFKNRQLLLQDRHDGWKKEREVEETFGQAGGLVRGWQQRVAAPLPCLPRLC